MRIFKNIFTILLFLLTAQMAVASFNVYDFENDPQKEQRFQTLINDLRCPKCQNNNLADSNAPLATDIKNYVYTSVKAGKSDDEIVGFLTSRYGKFIIYDPKIIWLWLIPLMIVLLGLISVIFYIKNKPKTKQKEELAEKTASMEELIKIYQQEKK